MPAQPPTVEFYKGIAAAIDRISLRRDRATGDRIELITFRQLRTIEQFQSFRSHFAKALKLVDEAGTITIEPEGIGFIFGGPEGDDLQPVDCTLVLDHGDHWDRLMRFLTRYAEANAMAYGEVP